MMTQWLIMILSFHGNYLAINALLNGSILRCEVYASMAIPGIICYFCGWKCGQRFIGNESKKYTEIIEKIKAAERKYHIEEDDDVRQPLMLRIARV